MLKCQCTCTFYTTFELCKIQMQVYHIYIYLFKWDIYFTNLEEL